MQEATKTAEILKMAHTEKLRLESSLKDSLASINKSEEWR